MNARRSWKRRLVAGTALAVGMVAGTSATANAATTATFSARTLNVNGDSAANTITVSRDAAGTILVNGGAVAVAGGTPTVANTSFIRIFGLGGNDVLTISEVNGALPASRLFGGADNDTLTGGSGADQLFGQAGNDTLLGKGGFDQLFGGTDNDTLTGGDADDQVYGQTGADRMIWNPGDDTDLNEGSSGIDTVEVNGGNGEEQFTTTANGTRVRFDRVNPAPFSIDIGTSEKLVLNANGGNDSYSAVGNLAALIQITVDGGANDDTLLGSNGADALIAGDGNDFVDGQQGNDTAFLGAGNDTFQWDPGDGSDVVEGQAGTDAMTFNGANISENMTVSANGGRVRFTRDVAAIVMDLDDVESITARMLGGADNLVVDDLSGTDMTSVIGDLAAFGTTGDTLPDRVVASGTNGGDVLSVTGSAPEMQVSGGAATVSVKGAEAGVDRVLASGLAGDDVIDGSLVPAGAALITLQGDVGDDVLLGGAGDDVLLGGEGDDVLIGGPGNDTNDGGSGDNVVLDAFAGVTSATKVGDTWVASHARSVQGKTVLSFDGAQYTLPHAQL